MKKELKQFGLRNGDVGKIAKAAKVCHQTVTRALSGAEGVAKTTRLRVFRAVTKVREADVRETEKAQQLLNSLLNPAKP